MSAPHHRSPQISRIARLLAVEAIDVVGLDGIAEDDLRVLHDQIGQTLFADGQHRFARVAALSKMLPGAMAGKLAERFLPPTLAARVAELLEPAKARELVTKVSVGYLADLALVLDPTRSKPVVQAIPADRVAAVARELFDRKEYGAMAEFAGTVTLESLFAALHVSTARDLVEVVPLLVWNDNIDLVIADIPAAKIDAILSEIVAEDLWEQATYLIERLHPEAISTVAKALFARGEYSAMAQFAGIVDLDALFAALDVATARDLLEIVPLIEWNATIEQVIADIPADRVDALLSEIVDAELWEHGNYVIEHLGPVAHERALERIGAVSGEVFEAFHAAAAAGKLGDAALELLASADAARAVAPAG
jgi:hypothetical protein